MFVPLPETLSPTKLLRPVEAKNSLQVQITELSTSKSSSSEEVENLKHRVDDTEREKRDLVGVISRLKQETSQREGESWFLFSLPFLTNSQRKYKLFAPISRRLVKNTRLWRLKFGSYDPLRHPPRFRFE